MQNKISFKLISVALFLFTFVVGISAQNRTRTPTRTATTKTLKSVDDKKRISEKDRKAIVSLFRGVPSSEYRLQFYNGERKRASKYGRLRYNMNDLKRVQRLTNPIDEVGWIVFVVEGDDVIYVLAVGSDKLKSVLGAEKAARLNSIMAKYQ